MGYTHTINDSTGFARIFNDGQMVRQGYIENMLGHPYSGNFPVWLKRKHREFEKTNPYFEYYVSSLRPIYDHGYFQGFNHGLVTLRKDLYWSKSVDQIAQAFRRKRAQWYQTNEYALLRRALMYLNKGAVTKMTDAAAFQISAAEFISQYLGKTGILLPVFAQDPIYSKYDEAFLTRHLRFNIVHDPDAYQLIDEDTLVVSCGTGRMPTYYTTKIQGPMPMAMLCWNPLMQAASLDSNVANVVRHRFALYDCHNIGGVSDLDFWSPRKSWTESEKLWIRKRGS